MPEYASQQLRKISPELDPLRLGTGWTESDLSRPQVYVFSTAGDSHPGSAHLLEVSQAVCEGIRQAGGRGARYFATDMCDGESQGSDGINYSLASREMIAGMIELQEKATPFDAGVFCASCDKSVPGSLMGMARLNIPSVFVPGGVMQAGPRLLTLNELGVYSARYERGEIGEEELAWAKQNACTGCGACSFMGTACTMQIMAESLGLALPGSALLPAVGKDLSDMARKAGQRAVLLASEGLKVSDIVTRESFENAILVHAAISGSTNALLHLPAIAHELGIELTGEDFDRLHRGALFLTDIRPTGRWPAEVFSYAGGVPAVMEQIRDRLHLDVLTVTGRTLKENLEELRKSGYYERCRKRLDKFNEKHQLRLTGDQIIHPAADPLGTNGSIAVLYGNLAPEGAVIKHTACPKEMHHAILRARPFDCEEDCLSAVLHGGVQPGDAVLIRYEGPKGSGMPEMFYTSEAISSDKELSRQIALITDGRFSGASTGPVIGHVSPEAVEGGPIALVEEGDLIEIDVEKRILRLIGLNGQRMTEGQIQETLQKRRREWVKQPHHPRYSKGVLGLYARHAVSPMKGAYMD